MAKSLVIVESPAKARTIAAFLGKDYMVESSIGHIRDLPKSAREIPASYKGKPWARLGVDVDNDFRPLYVLDAGKKTQIQKLKKLMDKADEVLLATDEDREGESIAWHLFEVLKPKVPVKRMVFHEITRKAIESAIDNPRGIDQNLVDAQEARRILDRLYGYEVSPVLWKKVMPRLSAGRVQSVATRMVVARERERIAFVPANYWGIEGSFAAEKGELSAQLATIDDARLAAGKDFDARGKVKTDGVVVLNADKAAALVAALERGRFAVKGIEQKPYRRSPSAPFMTSTLQQEAGRKLRFSAARTMRAAQRLYENGYITYMRTDSTTLSDAAIELSREQIRSMYGDEYVPAQPREYKSKVKNAQEAHEAIRPTGNGHFRTPEEVSGEIGHDEAKIYELVWKRTLASQMEDARGQRVQLRIEATLEEGRRLEFTASGLTITFPGFLRAYVEGSDDPDAELENRERHLPELSEGETLTGKSFEAQGHDTQPPARYTEASLVRHLEELGVGRPSTYASIINTIVDRGYVWKKGTALVPSFKAFAVVSLLEDHFGELVDYAFTARMEEELDEIARGEKGSVPWLKRFYFGGSNGNDEAGLKAMISQKLEEIDAREINTLPLGIDPQGRDVAVRVGRYGPYLQRNGDTANLRDDMAPDELTLERAIELLETPSDKKLGVDAQSGMPVFLKDGRFGTYVQLGEAQGEEKPKTQSLLRSDKPENVTLEHALKLLSLPRVIGSDAEGKEITVHNGRYGPYIARGSDRRSLEREEDVFEIGVDAALHLLAQPKQRRQRAAPEPIRELGADPVSGQTIRLLMGRYGPYVTDGETNASLRTGDTPDGITPERAHELLQLRRERVGDKRPRRAGKKAASKKGAKKPAKKAAKKIAKKKKPSPMTKRTVRAKKSKKKKKRPSTANGEAHRRKPRPTARTPLGAAN
ncbi:MAG TPA: type I DNA topoisomerase [Polyangiaceae bacterium]|nr:type I DNA topoisomerase [Polyangiaceae bacterium]